jgi:hypothetical protein
LTRITRGYRRGFVCVSTRVSPQCIGSSVAFTTRSKGMLVSDKETRWSTCRGSWSSARACFWVQGTSLVFCTDMTKLSPFCREGTNEGDDCFGHDERTLDCWSSRSMVPWIVFAVIPLLGLDANNALAWMGRASVIQRRWIQKGIYCTFRGPPQSQAWLFRLCLAWLNTVPWRVDLGTCETCCQE